MITGVVVSFENYVPGMAPALIINHTSRAVQYKQRGTDTDYTLHSHTVLRNSQSFEKNISEQVQLYTWSSVLGERVLEFKCGQAKWKDGLYKVQII